jgi:hypothetical protein
MHKASATVRTLSPAASRDIARSRKSIDKGRVIDTGLRSSTKLESETSRFGNPKSIRTSLIPL